MNADYLTRMANQLADALQAHSEIAEHLQRFWEPRMREALVHLAEQPAARAQLSPAVLGALARLHPKA